MRVCRIASNLSHCFLVLLLLISRSGTADDCLPPTMMPPLLTRSGNVLIQWVQPQHLADTLVLCSGAGYTRDFLPGHGLISPQIAIRLEGIPYGGMLRSIRAYFRASPGATPEEWAARASFCWTLCPDSAGQPAAGSIAAERWILSDNLLMINGQWMAQDVEWWLPATHESGFWLVGSWDNSSDDIVRLGADHGALQGRVLLGASNSGSVSWVNLSDPGLLIELTILPSGRAGTAAQSGSSSCDSVSCAGGSGFSISREVLSGPMSPCSINVAVEDSLPWVWRDTAAVVGQELRYMIGEILPEGGVIQSATADFTIDPRWPLYFSPAELRQDIQLNTLIDFTFVAVNGATDSLVLYPVPPVLEAQGRSPGSGAKPMIVTQVTPAVGIVPPADSQFVVFQVDAQGAPPGEYEGMLLMRVLRPSVGMAQKWGVPVHLTIDLTTSVGITDPAPPGSNTAGQDGLQIRALGNPFGDRVALRITMPSRLTSGSRSASEWGGGNDASMAEITLYDMRGRRLLRRNEPVRIQGGSDGTGSAEINLSGLAHWPSGVYLCRVRIADAVAMIKLCHIK